MDSMSPARRRSCRAKEARRMDVRLVRFIWVSARCRTYVRRIRRRIAVHVGRWILIVLWEGAKRNVCVRSGGKSRGRRRASESEYWWVRRERNISGVRK